MKKEDKVLPGDYIAPKEAFLPGFGTYEKKGEVRSCSTGNVKKDMKKRKAKVMCKPQIPKMQRKGLIVEGEVDKVTDSVAFVDLFTARSKSFRYVPRDNSTVLRVRDISDDYTESARDAMRAGDIARFKVVDITGDSVVLGTIGKKLGVIQAYCSKCRHPLKKKNGKLVCPHCKNKEERKIASDYGE